MNNTSPISILLLCLSLLQGGHTRSQSNIEITPPETRLTDILLKDTTSKTVSYPPRGYWFGMKDRSNGWPVLVKNGPKNYLLRDGTHHVYLLQKKNGKIHLERLDSSVFSGDNFLMMAFLRKDTIYQYGGYGFWNTRDFFMRYRSANRDWEFLTGGNGLKNELNYHWYDKSEDAFYMIGSLSSTHHPVPKKMLIDSIYRFGFDTRQWKAIGRLNENFSELNLLTKHELAVCFTPFGFLDTRTFQIKLYDIPGNRILSPKGHLTDFLLRIAKGNSIQFNEYKHFIYLGDTLHIIQGTQHEVYHDRIKVTLADFDTANPQTIYVPVNQGVRMSILSDKNWLLFLPIPLIVAGFYWRSRQQKRSPHKQGKMEDVQEEADFEVQKEANIPLNPTGDTTLEAPSDHISFFRSQLSPIETELLDMLVKVSLAGEAADIISINKTIGVTNKDASLQKARRSICINNINNSFRQTLKQDDNLIIRERNEDDKRAFVYRIDEKHLSLFRNI
jgi:hypothetical protein